MSDKPPGQLETLPRGLSDPWEGRQAPPQIPARGRNLGLGVGVRIKPHRWLVPVWATVPQPSCDFGICVSRLSLPVESRV